MDKSYSRRLALNSSIFKNPYWVLPVDDKGHELFEPVGRGIKSSPACGKHVGFNICKNVEGHKGKLLRGEDATNKIVVYHKHLWCHKSACPVCFIRGWSVRGARSIEGRFVEAVRRDLGEVEHVAVSPSVVDRDLPEYVLRKKCRDALANRGIVGGCMIFHGYRIDKKRNVLVWSPHYHSLGFIENGFGKCRSCVFVADKGSRSHCRDCKGFYGRSKEEFKKDGCIVEVMDKRNSIFGTAFYQLNHATIRLGVKRFHVFTWLGSCGNRKFKSEKLLAEISCAVCSEEMVRAIHVGSRHIVKDVGHPDYKPVFLDDEFDENGEPNYMEIIGGSGNYG